MPYSKKAALGPGLRIEFDEPLANLVELEADAQSDALFAGLDENSYATVIRLRLESGAMGMTLLVREPNTSRLWFRDIQKYIRQSRQIRDLNRNVPKKQSQHEPHK